MGLNKFIAVISDFLDIERDEDTGKKKSLKKLLKKLEKCVCKLQKKIAKEREEKQKNLLEEELLLVHLHIKKGKVILAKYQDKNK